MTRIAQLVRVRLDKGQDHKNRQNSIDDLSEDTKQWFNAAQDYAWNVTYDLYKQSLDLGIAKESARFLLPLNTMTMLYMKGNIRSWIHYLLARTHSSTQKEHRDIALGVEEIFKEQLPTIFEMYQMEKNEINR
jgi:thymidylate synthase (FAD)